MSTVNLHANDPTLLVDRSTPPELLDAIQKLPAWDEKALETANLLITVWTSNAIARQNDREGISELQRLIHYALNRSDAAVTLPDEYRYRWEEASDLLESRRLNLAHADPEAQINRQHVREILELLHWHDEREFPQSELAGRFGVTTGRVTQIVGPLEANGLITKRKQGREVLLQLTTRGKSIARSLNAKSNNLTTGMLLTKRTKNPEDMRSFSNRFKTETVPSPI
jgi:DNA-binding MarR family transcriptional regulator